MDTVRPLVSTAFDRHARRRHLSSMTATLGPLPATRLAAARAVVATRRTTRYCQRAFLPDRAARPDCCAGWLLRIPFGLYAEL